MFEPNGGRLLALVRGIAKNDLSNFSIPGRIVFGAVALLMTVWMLGFSAVI